MIDFDPYVDILVVFCLLRSREIGVVKYLTISIWDWHIAYFHAVLASLDELVTILFQVVLA